MADDRRDFAARLGAALRKRRKTAGLTQVELCAILDEPQSFVSRYETGERRLEFYDVVRICDAVGADVSELRDELQD